jgi:hypothetical protein
MAPKAKPAAKEPATEVEPEVVAVEPEVEEAAPDAPDDAPDTDDAPDMVDAVTDPEAETAKGIGTDSLPPLSVPADEAVAATTTGDPEPLTQPLQDDYQEPPETSTRHRVIALRTEPRSDGPEAEKPTAGTIATSSVYAEVVLAGTVTPTFVLIASAGVPVNPADLALLEQ